MARKPNAAENVDFKQALPIVIGNVEKGLGLEDAEIIDEDIDAGNLARNRLQAAGYAEIRGNSMELRVLHALAKLIESSIHASLGAAIDDDLRAFSSQRGGNGKADARR